MEEPYSRKGDLCINMAKWTEVWGAEPIPEWVHMFIHTLGKVPTNWYIETKMR